MKNVRKLTCLILSVLLLACAAQPVAAADSRTCIRQMINYYRCYESEAQTDIDRLTEELAGSDPELAEKWGKVMAYWDWVNTEMEVGENCLPDGLPEDDSLGIVVLGYELAADGSIKPQLEGRLEAALRSLEKYPNAFIICTGGGTAKYDKNATEARQMERWLKDHGVMADKILMEPRSYSTVANAQYTCKMLAEDFPQIKTLAVITSDYHLHRGSLLFGAEAILSGYDLTVAAGGAYIMDRNYREDIQTQTEDLCTLTGISISGMKKPRLSQLSHIVAEGEGSFYMNVEPEVTVRAVYDSGYERVIKTGLNYSGIDFGTPGIQTLTIAYTADGITYSTSMEVELLPIPTEAPTQLPSATEPTPVEAVPAEEPRQEQPSLAVPMMVAAALLATLSFLLRLKKQ